MVEVLLMLPRLCSVQITTIKKNLRLFNGFPFLADSDQYNKKREKLLKSVPDHLTSDPSLHSDPSPSLSSSLAPPPFRSSHFTNSKLKGVCTVLDLEKKGTHSDLVDRILNFLVAPKSSGKVSEWRSRAEEMLAL